MNHFEHGVYETSQNMTMHTNTSHIRGKILYTKGQFYQNKLDSFRWIFENILALLNSVFIYSILFI